MLKRLLRSVSVILTLALVFGILTCAPFSAHEATPDEPAATAADIADSFGEPSGGKYTLADGTTYQLTEDVELEGYIEIPSGVTATIDLNGHTIDRGLSDVSGETNCADFIVNNGTLTVTDSSGDNSGMLTGGYADRGGAVVNNGTLTVEGGTFFNNRAYHTAGAVLNNSAATLNVTGGVFKGNSDGDVQGAGGGGGAIVNYGTMNMSGGTITGNTAHPNGGGIWNGQATAVLNLSGGTITDNYATGSGSGIYARADGAVNMSGSPVVNYNAKNNLYLNGDGVINFADGSMGRFADVDVSADNMPRAVTAGFNGYNRFSFACGGTSTMKSNGEIAPRVDSDYTVTTWDDLKSKAEDNNNVVINLGSDITNINKKSSIHVNKKTVVIDLMGHHIDVNRSNESSGDDYHFMYVQGGSDVTVRDSVGGGYITGGYATNGGAFNISDNDDSTLRLYHLTLKGNKASGDGGAIYNQSHLYANGVEFENNKTIVDGGDDGGAIFVESDAEEVTIKNSVFKGNSSHSQGGAIDNSADIATSIENAWFVNNASDDLGGAIAVKSGGVTVSGGAFLGNSSAKDGGAVYIGEDETFTAEGTVFSGNSTGASGGAIASHEIFTLTGCTVSGNTAAQWGGGLYSGNGASSATVSDTLLKNNSATSSTSGKGGAVYITGDTDSFDLINCTVTGNSAKYSGGAVHVQEGAVFTASSTVFTGNRTTNTTVNSVGGAIYAESDIRLNACTVTGNTASVGGGVWTSKKLKLNGKNNITGNSCSSSENNVYLSGTATVNLQNVTLASGSTVGLTAETYNRVLVTYVNAAEAERFSLDDPGDDTYSLEKSYDADAKELSVDKIVRINVSSWQALQDAADNGDDVKNIVLSRSITAPGGSTRIKIEENKKVILDLNGFTLNRNRTSKDKNGHVIEVKGDGRLTVRDSSSEGTGRITGGWANNGGGINVNEDGELTLESGSVSGNKAGDGGGVYIHDDGKFTMSGGSIDNNTATGDGGGIYADYTTDITGGTISGNKAKYGGGYYFDDSRLNLELKNLTISRNEATAKGSAVYLQSGRLTLTDCTVSENTSADGTVYVTNKTTLNASGSIISDNEVTEKSGGAIVSHGTVNLNCCTLEDNTANTTGGSIWSKGTLTLRDTTITGNKAMTQKGGGLCILDGTLTLIGGSISGNTAYGGFSGVYYGEDADGFTLGGAAKVEDNTRSDVYLTEGKKISLITSGADAMNADANVGVSVEACTATVTTNYSSAYGGTDPAEFFCTENGSAITTDDSGEVMVIESEWTLLRKQFSNSGTIVLDRDWTAISRDKSIEVPAGKTVTLDLNGHKIDAKKALSDSVIKVNGTLTIQDNSENQNGKITGGSSTSGGALYVFENGALNIEGGAVSENSAAQDGGGIYNKGTLTVSGGAISDNTSKYGAGVYNRGAATITGGSITGNTASVNGGGVWNCRTLTFKGGVIKENNAVREGGGVFIRNESDSVLNVEKEPAAEDNHAPIGGNILLKASKAVTLTGELYPTAKLDVVKEDTTTAVTAGFGSHNSPSGVFTYNGKTGLLAENESDRELYLRQVTGDYYVNSWTDLQNKINASSAGQTIVLKADLDGADQNRLNVDNKKVTIELNGHTINRNRTNSAGEGQVFGVTNYAELTITDAAGTGVIKGGFAKKGGGFYISSNSTLTVKGGSIQDNIADSGDGGDGGGVYTEGKLVMTGGSISFNKADDTGGGVYCTATGTIQLDGALITGNYSDDDDGGGMNIHLKDNSSYIKNSVISNNSCGDNHGGGIRMDANQRKLEIRDTKIIGNKADEEGGGVKLTDGTIRIYDSEINYNIAEDGAGIYTESGSSLHAENTHFDHNTSEKYGAGGINCRDKMELTGCFVNENKAVQGGGGVYLDAKDKTITITDTEINGNRSEDGDGGGVKVNNGKLELTGCSVSDNYSKGDGGGVYQDGQELTAERCHIDRNFTPSSDGGGVHLQTGKAYVRGGTISNNFAKYDGGGVCVTKNTTLYVEEAEYTENDVQKTEAATFDSNGCDQYGGAIHLVDDGSLYLRGITVTNDKCANGAIYADEDFYIQGKIIVLEDKGPGVFMEDDDDKIHPDGPLDEASDIGVQLDWKTGKFTDGFKTSNPGADPKLYFHASEDGYAVAENGDGEVRIRATDWVDLQYQFDHADAAATIELQKDYKADQADTTLIIPRNKNITLDLKGHKLDGGGAVGAVLRVSSGATLTVRDTVEIPEGVTGSQADELRGRITGATDSGVANYGTMTLEGGIISGNAALDYGGGLDNRGTMTISGGKISGNSSGSFGGGIYNAGTLTVAGGEIKSNRATNSGGGIYNAANAQLHVSGKPYVKDNTSASGKNIMLDGGAFITLDGRLDDASKLDVAVKAYESKITKNFGSTGTAASVFSYNENPNVTLVQKDDGELYTPFDLSGVNVWVGTWAELQSAVNNNNNQNKIIGLSNDLGSNGQQRITVENGRVVTLELAGHTMNRALTSKQDEGNVFWVTGSGTHLTIRDTVETGVIKGGFPKGDGGGFYVRDSAKLTVTGGSIQGNRCTSDGAGVYVDNAELVMTGGAVSGNKSEDNAGGIYTTGSAVITLTNARIIGNISEKSGAGLNLHLKADAAFTGCLIEGNETADGDGGGLVMNASGKKLTLDKTDVKDNIACDSGGGIYVDSGDVILKGKKEDNQIVAGRIEGNKAEDGGGVYVTGGDKFTADANSAILSNTTTKYSGGGVTCHGELELNGATVALNHSAKYGGGVFYQNSGTEITLTGADIAGNTADNDGGGLYIKQGAVTYDGGRIRYNTSIDGGGVFVTDKTKFNAKNGAVIEGNSVSEEDGGGIVNKGETSLDDVTITNNTAKENGGGIWNDDKLTVKGCTITSNTADGGSGGGIAHVDGNMYLEGSNKIELNNTAIFGAGVYVDKEANNAYIKGRLEAYNNNGQNIYLDKEFLTLNGELHSQSLISVSTYDDTGTFTKKYKDYHGAGTTTHMEPSTVFISDYDYTVYTDDKGEAAMKWVFEEEDKNAFIDRDSNMLDAEKVTGRNWMAGVSGERKLNEINLIRAHDAVMNNVEANVESSEIRAWGYLAAGILAVAGIGLAALTGGVSLLVVGAVGIGVMDYFQWFSAKCAKTQYRYIDEMMNMGVRIFDLRLNNRNWEDLEYKNDYDDNKNLWHCHGEKNTAGCFYGCNKKDKVLSANMTLEWAKEFLQKHPTEVLFFEYSMETQDNEKYETLVVTRLRKILKEFSYEINPSTGKPYLYMEDGVFGKEYTRWPKLKEARGQILYKFAIDYPETTPSIGGYQWDMGGESPTYARALGSNDTVNTPKERVHQLESAAAEHPSPNILPDAMTHRGVNSGYYANTTDDPMALFNWFKGKQAYFTDTPLNLEKEILYGSDDYIDKRDTAVFYELRNLRPNAEWYGLEYETGFEGLLREGGTFNQKGEYYGIFSFDGVTEREASLLWGSNFYDGLETRTVTVKSGLDGDDTEKTYKVLKGTPITIPNCIFKKPDGSVLCFQNWSATTTGSKSWDSDHGLPADKDFGQDYTGRDNREYLESRTYEEQIDPATRIAQNTTRDGIMPGETITIMDDTTFTAVWDSEVKLPVSIVWNDGDDADELRPDQIKLSYQLNGASSVETVNVGESTDWTTMLGDAADGTLKVDWADQINVTAEKPNGDEENGYSYTAEPDENGGYIVTLTHKPLKQITAAGTVGWDDNGDSRHVRPDSVTLKLIRNGEQLADDLTVTSADNWGYNFGTFDEYHKAEDGTYQRDVYTVEEEPFKNYCASYDDFSVINTFVKPDTTEVYVDISWNDGVNSYGKRPQSVTLHLYDGETEIDKKTVPADADSAVTTTFFDVEQYELENLDHTISYRVTQEPVTGYKAPSVTKADDGVSFTIVNDFDDADYRFKGHSISLNGDIVVNFYLSLTDDEESTAKISFKWFDKSLELNASELEYNGELGLYKAPCPVAVAEMTYNVTAALSINGEEVETNVYSVSDYANLILTDKTFMEEFIEEKTAETGDEAAAKEKYSQLISLVLAMEDYGAKAQIVFDRNTEHLANSGVSLYRDAITSADIESKHDDMRAGLEEYGLEYQYSSVVFLSGMTLRHFYKVTDQAKYKAVKSAIKFADEENNTEYAVTPAKRGELICFQKKDIAASQLDNQYALKIGGSSYRYSVMDAVKALMESDIDEKTMELCRAVYRYNQAANTYFDD